MIISFRIMRVNLRGITNTLPAVELVVTITEYSNNVTQTGVEIFDKVGICIARAVHLVSLPSAYLFARSEYQ